MVTDRVSIDVDGKMPDFERRALSAYHNLRAFGASEVVVRVSSSHEGIHLIGWFDQRLDRDARMRLREMLRDDPHRVRMDHERGRHGHTTGVCWREKSSRDGEAFEAASIEAAIEFTTRSDGLTLDRWSRPPVPGRSHPR